MADPWAAALQPVDEGAPSAPPSKQATTPDAWANVLQPVTEDKSQAAPPNWLQSYKDEQAAALQGVNPNALSKYFPTSEANRPQKLGDLEEYDWGPGYTTAKGELRRINPQTDFIARDPDTGQRAVYTRTPQTDESRITSASRLIMPGLAVGPVSSSIRAVPEAAAASRSARVPGTIGTAVGADLAAQRTAQAAQDVESFNRLDVRKPPIAFMQGPAAMAGKQLSEVWPIGAPIKNSLDEALSGLATATENVASRYGTASTPETAGAAIRQGIDRFRDARPDDIVERAVEGYSPQQLSQIIGAPARDTSMKTKQAALYQRAWSLLPEEMQQGRSIEGLPRIMGGLPATREVLNGIQARNLRMINASAEGAEGAAAPIASSGLVGRMIQAMQQNNWTASLQTMRDIRSNFRRMASGMADTEKNTLSLSDIDRVQSAITQDMIGMLQRNVESYRSLGANELNTAMSTGADTTRAQQLLDTANQADRSITEFRRADMFTRLAAQRMETIERLFNAPSSESLYRNVMNAALSSGRGDLQKLRVLSKTLRPEEMNDVAAAVIRQLGEPVGSARGVIQETGFSPSSALTRWNNMTPEARSLIFGSDHAQALQDWFNVTSRLANVEALANVSRSGQYVTNTLMAGAAALAALNHHTLMLVGGLAAGGALSYLLSRPSYVRWVTTYAQLRAQALRAPVQSTAPRMATAINQLGNMARQDPALIPILHRVAAENGVGPNLQDNKKKQNGTGPQ